MRVLIHAVGRMKSGPERLLADRYLDRLRASGGAIGLEFSGVQEIPESRAREAASRMREEAGRLRQVCGEAALILLDERGKHLDSPAFADRLGILRDAGRRQVVLAIGGADGHEQALRDEADLVLSLGAMTWPHQLARVMLAEQLYRATTILAGHPYHRA